MSSDIGSRKIDWTKFGVVYAGAQKNLGAAGCTVAIVREDLLGKEQKDTPFIMDWALFDRSPNGHFNTPATYPIYVTGLNVAHMIKNGGVSHYADLAKKRSSLLYGCIDASQGFYSNHVNKMYRSEINVPFRIRPDAGEDSSTYTRLELQFIAEAEAQGLMQLKGHSKNPGIRVSMYNAMKVEGVEKLVEFMKQFRKTHDSEVQNRARL